MFDYFKRVIDDRSTVGRRGFMVVWATVSMSTAIVLLSVAALFGYDVALALAAVATPLATMVGYSYGVGKKVEGKPDAE